MVNARDCFAWYAEAIDKVYGEIAPTGADAVALVGREPFGVVGAVVPWNYPMIITAWKLAPALAAGNSVVLKPAEQSPLTAPRIAELAAEAGVPAGVLNVVPDGLAERLVRFAGELHPADPAEPATRLGAMVSEEHLGGVLARVRRAADGGARVLVGSARAQPVAGGAYMSPTVIDAPDPTDPIVQEEVFGPVLTIQRAEDLDHAVALANGTAYGLAAAVWTSDVSAAHRVARRLRAGTVWVNTFDVSSISTPFGGFKGSGHGRDRSLHALDAYTQLKITWISL